MSALWYDTPTVEDLHEAWRNAYSVNAPAEYLVDRHGRSEYVADLIAETVSPAASVLEVGCNCGPNLAVLQERGFSNLHGVEINESALDLLRATFPDLRADLFAGSVEEFCRGRMRRYDLIFTLAVLEHIHPDSEWIFGRLASHCRWLLSVEDEVGVSDHHFPRDYGQVFAGLGMEATFTDSDLEALGLGEGFVARLFQRVEKGGASA